MIWVVSVLSMVVPSTTAGTRAARTGGSSRNYASETLYYLFVLCNVQSWYDIHRSCRNLLLTAVDKTAPPYAEGCGL